MQQSSVSEWMLAHRRLVVTVLILGFLILIGVRFLLFPTHTPSGDIDWEALVRNILDGLIATVVVSFVVAVTLWWTKPPLERIPPGFEILPDQISKSLERAALESDEWEYVGHTGRYVRNREL